MKDAVHTVVISWDDYALGLYILVGLLFSFLVYPVFCCLLFAVTLIFMLHHCLCPEGVPPGSAH